MGRRLRPPLAHAIFGGLAVLALIGALSRPRGAAPPRPAVAAVPARDVRALLARLVAIPTDPPRGTTAAAEAMAEELRAAGVVDVEVSGPTPERKNLVARIPGSGAREPLLLLAHIDVVAADAARWSTDPWTLVEKDGYYHGRGVIDDKAQAAIFVEIAATLARERARLDRDVIVALTADEEEGEHDGVAWLLASRRARIQAGLCITEGGGGDMRRGRYVANLVQVSEKIEQSFVLEARAKGGDSAQPNGDNAIVRLARALDRASKLRFPRRTDATTRAYFAAVAAREPAPLADDLAAVGRGATGAELDRVAAASTWWAAMVQTTCEATEIAGGHGEGALPEVARATVNCRVLPDGAGTGAVDDVERAISAAIDDPHVQIARKWPAVAGPAAARDPALFAAVERVTAELWPGVPVTPSMLPSATDGRFLRAAGIPTYGVSGLFEDVDDVREHAADERIGVRQLHDAHAFLDRLVRDLSGAPRRAPSTAVGAGIR